MSDAKHIKRNFNGSVTKRMRYNYDDYRVDVYQFDKSQEQYWTPSTVNKVSNGVKVSASSYTAYQSENVLKPMVLTFTLHPKVAGNYRLELLYANTHTTSQSYIASVSKSLSQNQYKKIAKQFVNYCSSHKYTPKYLEVDSTKLDFRALLYGFATVLNSNSLPSSVTFTSNNFTKTITYQADLNVGKTVTRSNIVNKAKSLKTYIENNGTAPQKIGLGSTYVSISQFAELMSRAINSQNSSFTVRAVTPTSSYINSDVNYTITVDGEKIKNNNKTKGFDVVHSRGYAYFTITDEQVEKYGDISGKGLEIKYSFNTNNSAFISLVLKKYNVYSADKVNSLDCELTVESFDIQQTNSFDTNTATVNLMYHHGLDDLTKLNLSGYLFDYRDEINIFVKNNDGVMSQEFGGYISTVEVNDDLTIMTLSCADRLIDLEHRTSISEVYMNSITDTTEYKDKYDYVKKCSNWSSPLEFLCNYSELPLDTNISEKNPLVMNKVLKSILYGKSENHFNKLTNSNISVTAYSNSVLLRNSNKANVYQSVRIFDDKLMGCENKVVINEYPNIYIDYGLGEAETKG